MHACAAASYSRCSVANGPRTSSRSWPTDWGPLPNPTAVLIFLIGILHRFTHWSCPDAETLNIIIISCMARHKGVDIQVYSFEKDWHGYLVWLWYKELELKLIFAQGLRQSHKRFWISCPWDKHLTKVALECYKGQMQKPSQATWGNESFIKWDLGMRGEIYIFKPEVYLRTGIKRSSKTFFFWKKIYAVYPRPYFSFVLKFGRRWYDILWKGKTELIGKKFFF